MLGKRVSRWAMPAGSSIVSSMEFSLMVSYRVRKRATKVSALSSAKQALASTSPGLSSLIWNLPSLVRCRNISSFLRNANQSKHLQFSGLTSCNYYSKKISTYFFRGLERKFVSHIKFLIFWKR